MEHKEKMTSMHLKKRKYELKYASVLTSSAEIPGPTTAGTTKEDKEIQILLLKIKLEELKRDTATSASQSHSASPFYSEGLSTPSSSSMSAPPQHLMNYCDPGAQSSSPDFNLGQNFDSGGGMIGSSAPTISENYGMVEPHPAGHWQFSG
jgi:hypothetical protein